MSCRMSIHKGDSSQLWCSGFICLFGFALCITSYSYCFTNFHLFLTFCFLYTFLLLNTLVLFYSLIKMCPCSFGTTGFGAFFFLHFSSECAYLWQNLHRTDFQSYYIFCSVINSSSFQIKIIFGNLESNLTFTSSLAKLSLTFFQYCVPLLMASLPNSLSY